MADVTAWSNTAGHASFDVTAVASVYGVDLSTVAWRAQIRRTPDDPTLALDLTTENGGASFAAGVVTFTANRSQMKQLSGSYVWDFGFMEGAEFVRVDGGTFTVAPGVTR